MQEYVTLKKKFGGVIFYLFSCFHINGYVAVVEIRILYGRLVVIVGAKIRISMATPALVHNLGLKSKGRFFLAET